MTLVLAPLESTLHDEPTGTTHWDLNWLQRCHEASSRSSAAGAMRHAAPARMMSGYPCRKSTFERPPSICCVPDCRRSEPFSRIVPKPGWLVYERPRCKDPSEAGS